MAIWLPGAFRWLYQPALLFYCHHYYQLPPCSLLPPAHNRDEGNDSNSNPRTINNQRTTLFLFQNQREKIIAPFVFSFLFCTLNMIHYSHFLHSSSFWSRWWFGGIRWMAQWSRSFWARLDAHEEEIVHHQHFCLLPQQCRKVPRGAGSASPPAPGPSCALSSLTFLSGSSSVIWPSSVPFSTPQVTLLSSFELESHTWFSFLDKVI